jgi:hypothetical protein
VFWSTPRVLPILVDRKDFHESIFTIRLSEYIMYTSGKSYKARHIDFNVIRIVGREKMSASKKFNPFLWGAKNLICRPIGVVIGVFGMYVGGMLAIVPAMLAAGVVGLVGLAKAGFEGMMRGCRTAFLNTMLIGMWPGLGLMESSSHLKPLRKNAFLPPRDLFIPLRFSKA